MGVDIGKLLYLLFAMLGLLLPSHGWAASANCGVIPNGYRYYDAVTNKDMICVNGRIAPLGVSSAHLTIPTPVTGLSGASVTVSNVIPTLSAWVFSVRIVVHTDITGVTGIDVGEPPPHDPTRWGSNLPVTAGSVSDISTFGHVTPTFANSTDVLLTAVGGTFTGGDLDVIVSYATEGTWAEGTGGISTIQKGSLASRPAPGLDGKTYYITDAGDQRLSRDTGAMWEDLFIDWDYISGAPTVNTQARVSATDTTSNFLASKLVAGSNITLTPLGGGGNETLQIASAGGASPLTVREEDGTPSEAGVTTMRFPNGTVTVNSAGNVSFVPSGGTGFPPASQQRLIPVHAGAMSVQGSTSCNAPLDVTINGWRRPTITNCPDNTAALIDFEVPVHNKTDAAGGGWRWNASDLRIHWHVLNTNASPSGTFGVNIACRCLARSVDTLVVPSMGSAVSFDAPFVTPGDPQFSKRSPLAALTVSGGAMILGNCSTTDHSRLLCRAQVDSGATNTTQLTNIHVLGADVEVTDVWVP